MRVAIPLFPTVAFPVLVGADKGFFHKEGTHSIEPIRINSAPTTYQALISGDVHAVVGAPTGLLPSNLQGADIVSMLSAMWWCAPALTSSQIGLPMRSGRFARHDSPARVQVYVASSAVGRGRVGAAGCDAGEVPGHRHAPPEYA